MTLEETYRMLYGGYLGIREIDEYTSKEYVLKEVMDYINDYVKTYSLKLDFEAVNNELEHLELYRKLQDAVIVLNMINGPLELTIIIRRKLEEIEKMH